jgi:protein-S-isoprenylcysteine O-methyltransferase Ste14
MLLRALIALLVLPGVVGIVVPPTIAAIDPWRGSPAWPGVLLVAAGLVLLLQCARAFGVRGRGTLAPWDPPRNLVVVGPYRYVRNPMYVAVLALVGGWALTLASPLVALYAAALAVAFHLRVVAHEEPWLRDQFGDDWMRYRAHVARWAPRRKPWDGGS